MDGNGYTEEGFDEWARECLDEFPSFVEIIMMEDDLGIPNKKLLMLEDQKEEIWAYYHELKAKIEAQRRKTA